MHSLVYPHCLGFGPAVPAQDLAPWSIVGSVLTSGWGCRRNAKLNSGWVEGDGRYHSTDFSRAVGGPGDSNRAGHQQEPHAAHRAPHVQLPSLSSRMRNLLIQKMQLQNPGSPHHHSLRSTCHSAPITFPQSPFLVT